MRSHRIKVLSFAACIYLFVPLMTAIAHAAEDLAAVDNNGVADDKIPPKPKKRPSVMHASKAYVEELRARLRQSDPAVAGHIPENASDPLEEIYAPEVAADDNNEPSMQEIQENIDRIIEVNQEKSLKSVAAPKVEAVSIKPENPKLLESDPLAQDLKQPSRAEVLAAIENSIEGDNDKKQILQAQDNSPQINKINKTSQAIDMEQKISNRSSVATVSVAPQISKPKPKSKPKLNKPVNDIEPASGPPSKADIPSAKPNKEASKLMSFYLQPEVTELDEALSGFLKDRALKILQDDPAMGIEIRSFATPLSGQANSHVRIALARALAVRSYLMSNNVDPARLRLRPDNNYAKKSEDDRIDLVFIKNP